jgi:hypothetical protein
MPDDQFSSVVRSDGTAIITFTPTKNLPWLLKQTSIEMRNAPSGAVAELRKNDNLITPMVATDTADSDPPVPVVPGDRITVTWTGGTPGRPVSVYIIYQEVRWEML